MFFNKIFGLFIAVVSIEGFDKSLEKNVYRLKPTVCRTDNCKTMANVILSTMNMSADPCEDFYEYACGAWTNEKLPPDAARWSRFAMINKKISETLRTFLESNNVVALPVQKAKQWYRSCMNEEALESRGIEPLTSMVTAVGGWPIAMALGQWNPSDYSWQEIEIYYSRITGSYAMYNLVVIASRANVSMNAISLQAPSLPLLKNLPLKREFFDPEDREPYGKLIAGVARYFATAQGARVSAEKIAREASDMVEFEMKLEKIRGKGDGVTGNISLVQQFFSKQMPSTGIPSVNILKLVKNLFEGIGQIEITEDMEISVDGPYIIKLGALLNETSFRTIVNYVHWHYVSRFLHTSNSHIRNLLLEFMKETSGIKMAPPRWEQCVNQMELKHALSYQFALEHFTEDSHNSASEMITKIQIELEKQTNGSTWMDRGTKELYRDKLWNIKTLIGLPEWYKNLTKLEEYYEGLTINDDYFRNVVKNMRFEGEKMMQTLLIMNSQQEWIVDPITVNAFYIPRDNSLNIPAVFLQPPHFTPMMPDSVKYGMVGSILGYELSHGFHSTGSRIDKNGGIIHWPKAMETAYEEKTRCFIDHYNNFTTNSTTDKMFDGYNKLEENIADTTGAQSAFNAYKSLVRENAKGHRKPMGLEDFSNEQLFLLSYATIWCEISTPQYVRKRRISGDTHASPRVRTVTTMSNTVGFSEAFNCPKGSPMNPEKKCNIWTGESYV